MPLTFISGKLTFLGMLTLSSQSSIKAYGSPAVWLTATLRTDAGNAQMTAMLFCEGSKRQTNSAGIKHSQGRANRSRNAMPPDNGSAARKCRHLKPRQNSYNFTFAEVHDKQGDAPDIIV